MLGERWGPLLEKLLWFTSLGDHLGDVNNLLYCLHPSNLAVKIHPFAKLACSILTAIPKVR
jgi:hypothetical protein